MIKILCTEPHSFSTKGLNFASTICYLETKKMTQKEFEIELKYFQGALIRFNTKIDGALLRSNKNLKAIISPTTGLDHIDIKSAEELGIKVFHLRGSKKFLEKLPATAELTFGLMLSLYRKISSAFLSVKSGNWDPGDYRGYELFGKTLGIVGYGRLGEKVSIMAISFGMKVIFFDPKKEFNTINGIERVKSLDELLSRSDIISLHVHLSKQTHHMICYKEIALLKNNSIIINTSRGSIIQSEALLDALKAGKILGAALDVLEDEKSIIDKKVNRLIEYSKSNNNLIITPHIGGSTYESVEKADLFALKNFKNFIKKIK